MPSPLTYCRAMLAAVALVAAAGCSSDGPAAPPIPTEVTPTQGSAIINIRTLGTDVPAYIYLLQVDDVHQKLLTSGQADSVQGDATTTHRIQLFGAPSACAISGHNQVIRFDTLAPTPVTITVTCPAPQPGAIRIITETSVGFLGFEGNGNGAVRPWPLDEGLPTTLPLWSPDGRWLAVPLVDSGGGDALTILDPEEGKVMQRARIPNQFGHEPGWADWSPDGAQIAAPTLSGIQVIPVAGGAPEEIPVPEGHVGAIDWSLDGTLIAVIAGRSVIVMDPGGANRRVVAFWASADTSDHSYLSRLLLSPDNSHVALMTSIRTRYGGGGFGCEFLCDAAGVEPHTLWIAALDHSPPVFIAGSANGTFAWWPDGSRIVYDDGEGRVMSAAPDAPAAPNSLRRSGLVFPSADGSDVLVATPGGIVSATGGSEQLPSFAPGSLLPRIIYSGFVPAVRP